MRPVAQGLRIWLALTGSFLIVTFSSHPAGGQGTLPGAPPGPGDAPEALTLAEAVNEALDRNPLLKAARWKLEASRENRDAARALPGLQLEVLPFWGPRADAEVRVSQTFEISGRRRMRTGIAEELLKGARAAGEETVLDVILDVETAFYEVLAAQEMVEVARENVGLARRLLQSTRNQFEAGEVPFLDVMRAEVELARAEQELERREAALGVSQSELNRAMGRPADQPVRVAGELAEPAAPPLPPQPVEAAIARRPRVREAGARVEAARLQVKMEKAARFPDLVVQYFRNEELEDFAGIGVAFPLLDWGQIGHAVRRAESQVRQEEALLESVRQEVAAEVRRALIDVETTARLARRFRSDVLSKAEELLQKTETGYREGLLTSLDVLEAQRAVTRAREEYVALQAEHAKARARLRRALGISLPDRPVLTLTGEDGP